MNLRGVQLMIGLVVFCVGAGDPTPVSASNTFDGAWTTKMITRSGECFPVYKFDVSVEDGIVSGTTQGNLGKYTISGQVTAAGVIQILLDDGDSVEVMGKLNDDEGSGKWESFLGCSGDVKWDRR